MERLLIFLLASYGLTNIITGGRIFNWLQKTHHFFRCPMCIGFWVGCILAGVGIVGVPGYNLDGVVFKLAPHWLVKAITECTVMGFVSSGWCWIIRVVLHKLGEDDL